MIVRVNNKRGVTIGYLFDTVFISCESYNLLSCSPIYPKAQRLGKEYKDYCRIENTRYQNLETLISNGGISYVLEVLSKYGILLRSIIFFKVKKEQLKGYGLSATWEQKFKGVDLYCCCDSYGNCLGFIALKKNYIVMFEVLNKGIGTGTFIVKSLIDIRGSLKGMTTVGAKNFWIKQNAVFSPDGLYFSINN